MNIEAPECVETASCFSRRQGPEQGCSLKAPSCHMQQGIISHSRDQAKDNRLNVDRSPQFISDLLRIGQVKVKKVATKDDSNMMLTVKC